MKKFKQLIFAGACALTLCSQSIFPTYAATSASAEATATPEPEEVEPTTAPKDNASSTPREVGTDANISLLDNWTTPVAKYGQTVNIVLPLVNLGYDNLTNIVVTPEISTSTDDFPFEIEKTSYNVYVNDLPGSSSGLGIMDRRREITYTLKTRDNVTSGYQRLTFDVTYTLSSGETETTTIDTFIETVGKTGATSEDGSKVSTPRLIVSGFTTTPETVKAGDTFTLTLHITNTSKATAVSNLTFDLQAPVSGTGNDNTSDTAAFLPVSGSSIIFVDSIAAGATKDISIDLESRADLSQKPYVLTVNMEYEDSEYNAYTADASVSIPIKQEARFDIGTIDVMPASIAVGSESNVMFSINNTGKTTLYNVNVTFDSASVTGGDTFLGNIEIGATGNVDAMVTGEAVTADDGKVKAIISYEDESGNVSTQEKEFELFVTEETFDDFGMGDDMMNEEFVDGASTGSNHIVLIICIVVVVLALAGVAVFIILKKKKKNGSDDFFDLDEGESDDNELS